MEKNIFIECKKGTVKWMVLLPLTILFLFFSCKKENGHILVKQEQYQYPVLKSKALNHVLQLDIINMDTLQNNALTEVVLDLQGTDDLGIIESVSLFRVMDSIAFLGPDSELFAKNDKVTSKMSLKGNIDLDKGHNYFWLSYTSKDNAPIGKNVGGICTKVLTTKGTVKVMALERPKTLRTGIAVRKQFDDNVHTFRIPGLVTTNSGTLLACYDIRYGSARDLQGNIDIGISRSTDGGNNWEPMQIAMDMGEWGGLPQKFNGVSDAALLVDRSNNTVFVAGLWMHGVIDKNGKWTEGLTEQSGDWNHQWKNKGSQPGFGVRETSQFLIAKSLDDGKTWEEPVNITKMCKKEEWWLFAPAPGKGITLEDGTLVFPTQGRDKNGVPFSNITYSKDGGISWETSEPAYSNTTECAVVQLEDGSLMLNMRDNVNRKNKGNNNGRAIAVTNDLGKNWTEHATSHNALIEPVCMASLYRHVYWNGKGEGINMLFFSNPNSKDKRHKQTIKVSLDNGGTWPEKYWVELDGGQGAGYSCLTSVNNGTIGILYEGSQAQMTFQLLSIRDMLDL